MKKKSTQYANVPLYIILRNKRWFNTKDGTWLSDKQIEAYTKPKQEIKEHKLSHSEILEKRWDLNY